MEGQIGLWNPYILSGVSGFSYSNLPILSPDNWPHFLVPEKYFFITATFISFLKFWLIGVFAFLLFNEELNDKKWAFFSSVIYQFSGYTIWALFIYDVLTMVLFTTISLYLIWSMHKRSTHLNYIYLTIAFTLNVLSSNIAYTSHAMIAIGVLFFYRLPSQLSPERKPGHVLLFALAFLNSIILSAIRLIPVWIETHSSNRQFTFNPNYLDTSFFALRLFDPEVLGVNYRSSQLIINGLSDHLHGMHIHELMPHYFGVSVALLVLWAVVSPLRGKILFWMFYVVLVLSAILFIEPFDTILKIINPVYHKLSLQIFLPVGFCMLAGHMAKYIEENIATMTFRGKSAQIMIFFIITIIFYILSVWIGNFREELGLIRLLTVLSFIITLATTLIYQRWPQVVIKSGLLLGGILFSCILYLLLLHHHTNNTYLLHLKSISASILMLLLTYSFLLICAYGKPEMKRYYWFFAIPLFLLSFAILMIPMPEGIRELPDKRGNFVLAMLGLVRLIIVVTIFFTASILINAKKFSRSWLFPLMLTVLLLEQLPASKIHNHIVINPFYNLNSPYPPLPDSFFDVQRQPIKLDYKNYRVNRPNTLLSLPYYDELYGSNNEVLSSSYSIYGIRSYGGHYNVISQRYEKFIKGVIPELPSDILGYGVYTKINNERFLDLAGVKYDYVNHSSSEKYVVTRPNALSRFMLFQSYEVHENEESAFDVLNSPDFDPLRTVILEKDPGISTSDTGYAELILQYIERSTDKIELETHKDVPSVLLFNDSYHEGWKAFINGVEQPIILANRAFMAIKLPAGTNKIAFQFLPRYFILSLYASSSGILIFIFIALALYLRRTRSFQC